MAIGAYNGRDRTTLATASSCAADGTNNADVGAQCTAAVANSLGLAIGIAGDAFETRIRAGEIIAHRGWRVADRELVSIWAPYCWRADYHRSRYFSPRFGESDDVDDGPTPYNSVGFHAFKTKLDAELYSSGCHCGIMAVGTVALWGDVIEHEFGYRAEFARVASLDTLYFEGRAARLLAALGFNPLLRRLRRQYGVQ